MALITEDHLEQKCLDQVVLFQAADGQVSLDVRLETESVWLSQAQMAELFGRERSVITRHVGDVHFLHIAGTDRPLTRRPDKLVGNWLKLSPCAPSRDPLARLRPKPISLPCSTRWRLAIRSRSLATGAP
jgi:hypothetical protein